MQAYGRGVNHTFTSDLNEVIEKSSFSELQKMQEVLDPGLGEESNGGINTLEGQGPRG